VLKKTGIAVAIATVGLLAVSPLAFADDDVHQEKHQRSFQDNGAGHGNKSGEGNATDIGCNSNFQALDQPNTSIDPRDPSCDTVGESTGSKTEQFHENEN